jgi:hypothetical protein
MKYSNALIAGWFVLAGMANAHSFNVTMVVPAGEAEAALSAFLIASAERDSHPDETSDGHLGGVDSHVSFVEYLGDAGASLAAVTDQKPDILAIIAPNSELNGLGISGVWAFSVSDFSLTSQQFQSDLPPFGNDTATRVYFAARLIDIAVRAQDGVDDIAALARAVENH